MHGLEWESLEKLDAEIARLKAIQARGPVKGKLWTPHSLAWRIERYKKDRLQFTWPRVYRFRLWLAKALERLSLWVWP